MQNKNGFTLIEILFVMGVLSLLLLLSAPIKVSILDNQKEEQFLTTLENDLLYMQSISYLSTDNIIMTFETNNYFVSSGHGSKVLLRRSIPDEWKFDLRTFQEEGSISFNANGTIRKPGNLLLTTNKSSYKIVFPLGKGRCYIEKL
ncbi:competence type IV pilus minor pilin ComGD [Virgibacillus necropolis]|nr:competence type IV pilus minor pilin ComGD [Virgibacillus necropolis]